MYTFYLDAINDWHYFWTDGAIFLVWVPAIQIAI